MPIRFNCMQMWTIWQAVLMVCMTKWVCKADLALTHLLALTLLTELYWVQMLTVHCCCSSEAGSLCSLHYFHWTAVCKLGLYVYLFILFIWQMLLSNETSEAEYNPRIELLKEQTGIQVVWDYKTSTDQKQVQIVGKQRASCDLEPIKEAVCNSVCD